MIGVKASLDHKRIRRLILLVLTFFVLLVYSLQSAAGSAYYSLLMQPYTTVSQPPVILQNGTAGESTIYTSNTSAKVSVEAPSVYDFVDNNISNVDSNASIGTHFNFTAQQYGPDSLFDNLTEADTGGPINDSENFVDDNISNIDGVDDKGTHGNFTAQQYYDSYFDTLTEVNIPVSTTYQIHPTDFNDLTGDWSNETNAWDWNNATSATETKGKIQSDIYWHTWNNTGQGTISQVDLRIRLDLTGLSDDYLTISWYVGATQGTGTYEINSTNQGTDIVVTFNDVTEPTNGTWEWTDIGNIEIRQVGTKVAGPDSPTYAVDEVWGWVSASTPNYELDLEIRWTTADYDETNEYLCINVGTTDDEDLKVEVWTGSWTNLLTDLNASSWNNVSVSSYLTSDTLIVRFLGGTESGDSNQDSWQIECSLLHVWTWEYNYNLDLEIQWTDANYTRTNEELCIKTGTTDTEDIEVYVWNITGSSWHKVFDDLAANTWNNISVSDYLTDSNFTARFRGGNETGDATLSSWDIDASLLHVWNDIEDYVDNNTSNVDNSDPEDKGTHSNFTSQKYYDSIYDTLTEENTSRIFFEQVTVSSEQSTTNTAWTDVPGANVSFTPSSSTEEWFIFVTADIRSNSTSENQARFRYDTNGVSQRGETGVQQGTTSTSPIDPYNVYFHFSRITGVASEQTVKFQYQASSGATAYARNIHILCIRLDSAGLEYTEVNGDTSITGSQTLATLQFTPSSSGDYMIAYCTLVSELPTGDAGAETWLDYDSVTSLHPDAWSTPNTRRVHTDRDQFEPHGLFTKINLNTSQHTFRVQAQLRTAGQTSTARDVRIAAFRVDAFDLLEFDEDTAVSSTTGANTVRSVVNTLNPGEQRDYLILAGIHTISSAQTSREAGGVEIDDVFVQRKGDQRLSYAEIARIASHYAYVKTSSTSFKVETTYGTGGIGSDTIYSKQSVIYVLKIPETRYELDLEVQWTNVDYNEVNEELCIYGGNMSSEDILVDVWNTTTSTWDNAFTNLTANGWKNFSVTSWLTTSNFTIRFRGGNEIGDETESSWDIDATLLHVWTENYVCDYDYVLRVNNTVTDSWEIRLKKYADSNINRLQNCTIYFHNSSDGTSSQIYIQNGSYTNQTGPWYDLGSLETIYIAMTAEADSTGTSYVRAYLEIRIPGTTTYAQYIIEFEIT